MNNYYVYLLISSLDGKVFYVGAGHGNRMKQHVKKTLKGNKLRNPKKYYKIRSIFKKHGRVLYAFFAKNLTEQQAYRLEKEKIKAIGKEKLCNLADGGKGGGNMRGKKHSKEARKKMSLSRIGNTNHTGGKEQHSNKKEDVISKDWKEVY